MAGFTVILLYGIMIGSQASTLRAIFMFALRMAAIFVGRTYDSLTGLSVAAILLLLEQPMYVLYSGFLLSFGAVLGIVLIPPLAERLCRDRGRIVKGLCKAISGSVGIWLTTFPIQIYFYYEYPLYSMFINVLLLPFMSYIAGFGLVISIVPSEVPVVPWLLAWVCEKILWLYEKVCLWSRTLPAHALVLGAPKAWQVVLYYSCLLAMLKCAKWWTMGRDRCKSIGMAASVGVFLCSTVLLLWRPTEGLVCHFLSVGQGDCAVIQYEQTVFVVDCGSTSNLNAGKQILLPFLKYQGISEVEAVFVSHADADHMNGIVQWLEEYDHSHIKVKRIILPALSAEALQEEFGELMMLAGQRSIAISTLAAGERLALGEMMIEVLHPTRNYAETEDANGYSQVLLFQYQGQKILMTGDIGVEQEKQILEKFCKDISVLKAAHHGSKFSSSQEFLQGCSPECIILSYGNGNRYGHPHRAAVERMEAVGAELYRTPKSGMITVRVKMDKIKVEEFTAETERK